MVQLHKNDELAPSHRAMNKQIDWFEKEYPSFSTRHFNLGKYILKVGLQTPDKVALTVIHHDETHAETFTYRELIEYSNKVGNLLKGHGITAEDRVAVAVTSVSATAAIFLATIRIGAIFLPAKRRMDPHEAVDFLNWTRAKATFVDEGTTLREPSALNFTSAVFVLNGLTKQYIDFHSALDRESGDLLTETDTHRDDIALWSFTSGTTGPSKGVEHSQVDYAFACENFAKHVLNLTPEDVVSGSSGTLCSSTYYTPILLIFPLAVGAHSVVLQEYEKLSVETCVEKLFLENDFNISVFATAPHYIDLLLRTKLDRSDLASVRAVLSAGCPLPLTLHQRFKQRFGDILINAYGQSECAFTSICNRLGEVKEGSIGKLVPGFQCKVENLNDGSLAQVNQPGILAIQGQFARSYYQDIAKSRETFRGEWFYTSDIVAMDEEGFFFHHGRPDDLVKFQGKLVSPIEIEEALRQSDVIDDCCLVLRENPPNNSLVPQPCMFICLRKGQDETNIEKKLFNFLAAKLPSWKIPKYYCPIDAIPRNQLAKPDRQKLSLY